MVGLVLVIGFISYLCAFKVADRDFWWHLKAGEIMVQSHQLISTEPFAFTRVAQPYLATYEWLAQVTFYVVFKLGGAPAIIVLRTGLVTLLFLILLAIDFKHIWFNSFIVIAAAIMARPWLIERPQLFSYLLMAIVIWLAIRLLESPRSQSRRWLAPWMFPPLIVVWVNLHGGAALIGLMIFAAMVIQFIYDRIFHDGLSRDVFKQQDTRTLMLVGLFLGVATLVSPNTYHIYSYLYRLLTDRTIVFVAEWQPRAWPLYLRELGPVWVVSLLALMLGRRRLIFSTLIMVTTGYLSRLAVRHEILFIIAATAMTIYQLQFSQVVQSVRDWFRNRLGLAALFSLVAIVTLALWTDTRDREFYQRNDLRGYGLFALARGAYDFIEREHLRGPAFNTYGIGNYLLYRGYPKRLVYLDGRNVDYGFDFMWRNYRAGSDPNIWQQLEDEYHLTTAVIDYDPVRDHGTYPYISYLGKNQRWSLVYLDDWVAVYLKAIPENDSIIARHSYRLLTPENMNDGSVIESTRSDDLLALESELQRVIRENLDGRRARLVLGKLRLRLGREAESANPK